MRSLVGELGVGRGGGAEAREAVKPEREATPSGGAVVREGRPTEASDTEVQSLATPGLPVPHPLQCG